MFKRHKNRTIRDDEGYSLRASAFRCFDAGDEWRKVAIKLEAKPETIRRYYHDWLKIPLGFEKAYKNIKILLKSPDSRDKFVQTLSKSIHMEEARIRQILKRPWGLKTLMLEQYGLGTIEFNESEQEYIRNEIEWETFLRFRELCKRNGLTMEEQLRRINIVWRWAEKELAKLEIADAYDNHAEPAKIETQGRQNTEAEMEREDTPDTEIVKAERAKTDMADNWSVRTDINSGGDEPTPVAG